MIYIYHPKPKDAAHEARLASSVALAEVPSESKARSGRTYQIRLALHENAIFCTCEAWWHSFAGPDPTRHECKHLRAFKATLLSAAK